ncbi:MAG TPA: hypothetical protein VFN76_01125 [Candidatus Limnocylindria bacterium]|nr:hypothetical protein [Candidatus Limnocylindria bacterium]
MSLMLVACAAATPTPDIPIAGLREPITRENLEAARGGMAGGLLEAGWLPDGFALVNADYIEQGGSIWSVDLFYQHADGASVHIWQTLVSAAELGDKDPVALSEPIPSTDWNANPLPAGQVGRPGVVEFSTRLDDGRTVSIDSDLGRDIMLRILESLVMRSGAND